MNEDMMLGLGYILGGIRFSVNISKASDRPSGYRVRPCVRWQKTPPLYAEQVVNEALSVVGLEVQDVYDTKKEVLAWITFILRMDDAYKVRKLFADQDGLGALLWVHDNPAPKTYENFIQWAERYDNEIERLESSLLKETSKGV